MSSTTAHKAFAVMAFLATLAFLAALLAGCAPIGNFYRPVVDEAVADGRPLVFFRADAVVVDHLGATSFITTWVNTSPDTIRYLDVTAVPINAVGDKVASEVGGHVAFTGRATGPFPPVAGVERGVWPGAWYNGSIWCARLTRVRIEYGTRRTERVVTITDPDSLRALIAPAERRDWPEYSCT